MKGVIHRRDEARRDLIAIYRRYAREGGMRVADRFLAAAEATFCRLAGMPGIGACYKHDNPALTELHVFPISSPFKVYLVFYRLATDGIEIVRVLHGARDIQSILVEEFGLTDDAEPDATTHE